MAAAAAEEHEGHESAPNDQGKKGAQAKGDPTMFVHGNVVAGRPYHGRPDNGQDK
jgi:hypothetical protein